MSLILCRRCSWLSHKSLWLAKPPSLFLVAPSNWGCAKIISVQKGRISQHLRCRLITSQTLSQQLGKYVVKPVHGRTKLDVLPATSALILRGRCIAISGHGSCACLKTTSLFAVVLWTNECKLHWLREPGNPGVCLTGGQYKSREPDLGTDSFRRVLAACLYCCSKQQWEGRGSAHHALNSEAAHHQPLDAC